MDVTKSKSKYRQQLLPVACAFFVGFSFPNGTQRSLAAETEAASARGSVTFVTPDKTAPQPAVEARAPIRKQSRVRATKRLAKAPAPQNSRSARGDLVLVPQTQTMTSRQNNRSASARGPQGAGQIANAFRSASRNESPASRHARHFSQVRQANHENEEAGGADSQAKLLVAAHALSVQSSRESDYTRVVKQASQAIRIGAEGEQRQFAEELISWALNRRGRIRAEEGQQELANADFQAALDINPDNWRALHNRGVSYAQIGSFAEAFDDFNHVTQLSPKFAKAYANRATLFVQANDMPSALEDFQRAAKLDSGLAKAHVGIARIKHAQGNLDEALLYFEAAVEADPTNAEILCSRGDLLADMGHYSRALADYARTVEVDPRFAHAYRNGSWLLATCPDKHFRDAKNALLGAKQALEFGYGERHVALDTLAAAQANAGQFGEAIITLKDALDIAPDHAKGAYNQRLQLYEQRTPFRTEPTSIISQVTYEAKGQ